MGAGLTGRLTQGDTLRPQERENMKLKNNREEGLGFA